MNLGPPAANDRRSRRRGRLRLLERQGRAHRVPAGGGRTPGITFVRSDLGPTARVPARSSIAVEVPAAHQLCGAGRVEVEMVEHVLAALAGLERRQLRSVDQPGRDAGLRRLGGAVRRRACCGPASSQQGVEAPRLDVTETDSRRRRRVWIEARPVGDERLSHRVSTRLPAAQRRSAGRWRGSRSRPSDFAASWRRCRTFVLRERSGRSSCGKGLGMRVTPRDLLVFDDDGPIDNRLRFPNECARHKALDVLGDLALAGLPDRRASSSPTAADIGCTRN